ncbi:hypothetical protein NDU88_007552 [Pleurodeles waltl]|uniref:Uncharacterized protein n=1 Tax=Pleurodeles waltl TaxID=8319 RepID=A0AAV7NVA0_PLEWA|nr:hypothetical protein NDU88_007552 [Pleurodeles waltl]
MQLEVTSYDTHYSDGVKACRDSEKQRIETATDRKVCVVGKLYWINGCVLQWCEEAHSVWSALHTSSSPHPVEERFVRVGPNAAIGAGAAFTVGCVIWWSGHSDVSRTGAGYVVLTTLTCVSPKRLHARDNAEQAQLVIESMSTYVMAATLLNGNQLF